MTTGNPSPGPNGADARMNNLIERIAIAALAMMFTWSYNGQKDLEAKVYAMRGEMVTAEMLRNTEERITRNTDVRLMDLTARLDILIKLNSPPAK